MNNDIRELDIFFNGGVRMGGMSEALLASTTKPAKTDTVYYISTPSLHSGTFFKDAYLQKTQSYPGIPKASAWVGPTGKLEGPTVTLTTDQETQLEKEFTKVMDKYKKEDTVPPNIKRMSDDIDKAALADPKVRSTDKVDPNAATRFDSEKTDWSLMPFDAVEQINKVLEFGAKKYAAGNWKTGGGFKYTRVLNCLLRHVFAYMRGEDNDPESGLSHLAHAGCNVLFLLHYSLDKKKYTNDDRGTV